MLRSALAEWRAELLAELRKYSPDEPRVPKGNRHGGEWTKGADDASPAVSINGSSGSLDVSTSISSHHYAERDAGTRTDATSDAQPKLPPAVHLTLGQIIGSYLAGAGNYISQHLTTAGYYAADALSFGAASDATDSPPTFTPFPVTSPYFAAEGAATAQGVTTVTGASSLGDALVPESLVAAGRLNAAQRVVELTKAGLKRIRDERYVTLAVTETREGVRIISSSSDRVEPSVIRLPQKGERDVNGI